MEWKLKEKNKLKIKSLIKKYNIDNFLATLLQTSVLSDKEINTLFNDINSAFSQPEDLINCKEAVDFLIPFIEDENTIIVVRADYDVDGITSGFICCDGLNKVSKAKVMVSYPERIEGYGLQMSFCKMLVNLQKHNPNKRILLITVDNGITAIDEVEYLKQNDISVLITDHHPSKDNQIPNCIVVDPMIDNKQNYTYLCGAGVAFKIIQLLYRKLNCESEINQYLVPLCIATIADMMPMSLENLVICIYGLSIMNSKDCPRGIKLLKQHLGLNELTFTNIGWDISPRLNACGRMGNTSLASKLFFNDDLSDKELLKQIEEINSLNELRKTKTNEFKDKAINSLSPNASVECIVFDDCPEGLVGVVVNKIIEINHKPTIVLTKTVNGYSGSARGINGISIHDILLNEEKNYDTIIKWGGHESAAGIKVHLDKINEFKEHMANYQLSEEQVNECENIIEITDTLQLSDLNFEHYDIINMFPYDKSYFKEPIYMFDTKLFDMQFTSKKDKAWIYINDGSLLQEKKILLSQELTNKLTAYRNINRLKLVGTLCTDFMTKHKTITFRILDLKVEE